MLISEVFMREPKVFCSSASQKSLSCAFTIAVSVVKGDSVIIILRVGNRYREEQAVKQDLLPFVQIKGYALIVHCD